MITETTGLSERLIGLSGQLHEAGRRMSAEAVTSEFLRSDRREFLHAYGRLLTEYGHWVLSQAKAGVMDEDQIIGVSAFPTEIADTYLETSR